MTTTTIAPAETGSGVRLLAVGLLAAAVAHVPPTGHHLAEAPYMGVGFVVFTFACLGLLLAIASGPGRGVLLVAAALSAGAIALYVATRLVAFPGLAHDVGAWTSEPWGLVAVAAEALVAFVAVGMLSNASAS